MNPQMIEMAAATAVLIGVGYVWLWILARRFDKKHGHTYTRPTVE